VSSLPRAIVVGLDSITGLQTARILARRGVPVVALAKDVRHFCCRSRVCERIVAADTGSERLIDTLEEVGSALEEKGVLVPCTDVSVLLISQNRDRLASRFHVVLPAHDVVELLTHKASFYSYAQEHGLPVPPTFFLRTRADAEAAAAALTFPVVLKPSLRTPKWDSKTRDKAFKARDAGELLELYDCVAAWSDLLLAQQWIVGRETSLFSCNGYFDSDSKPLVTFVARKIRQWPPETGISSLGEECRNDAVLAETIRLFSGVGFRGLAYLEMKRDERTGRHFIIEPNIGRPTGRSAIAEAGGVELLFTMYADAVGLPLPSSRVQLYSGVKWIHAVSDLQSATHQWRRGELTIPEWWRSVRGTRADAVISRRDPRPFVFELVRGAKLAGGLVRAKAKTAHERAAPSPMRSPTSAP
jgi:D-aspartate ligase